MLVNGVVELCVNLCRPYGVGADVRGGSGASTCGSRCSTSLSSSFSALCSWLEYSWNSSNTSFPYHRDIYFVFSNIIPSPHIENEV